MGCQECAVILAGMKSLKGRIAIVGGGSRGAARGIALALGEAGATVYVAARTSRNGPKPAKGTPGTVEDTAEEVTARGGVGIPVRTDLSDEAQVGALFRRVGEEQGRLDVLTNSAWAADFMSVWSTRYWELSPQIWRETMETMNTYWLTTVYASRLMAKHRSGIVMHVTDNCPGDPSGYRGQILHDIAHEFINRLIGAAAKDAKKAGVAVVGLNPGFMRTEGVLMYMTTEERKRQFKFHLSESVEFIGRAARALASDPKAIRKTGQLLWASDLAEEYGFTDTDGKIPRFDYSAVS
jgi:NAD(P)-dependent dehydrogenase (short-subunit alcohol dehydrogenase family)